MAGWTTEVTLDVAWGEMDALGHVNNVRYIAWAETARIAFFEKLGMTTRAQDPVGPILARIENDYLEPVEYPARITVGVRPERVGNTSLTLLHEIWHAGEPARVVARGRAVVVLIDYATNEKVRVPEAVRAALVSG
ncbi:MAG TPA: thioesterase family protein [Myxococcaceae bacterium]|nr:thioesterase family protein [Myxococcaceae bacterium]